MSRHFTEETLLVILLLGVLLFIFYLHPKETLETLGLSHEEKVKAVKFALLVFAGAAAWRRYGPSKL